MRNYWERERGREGQTDRDRERERGREREERTDRQRERERERERETERERERDTAHSCLYHCPREPSHNFMNKPSFIWPLGRKGSGVWPSMVTHTWNLCSAFNPSKCTHTVVNTHLEQWAANAAAPGEQLEVWCLAQGSHLSRDGPHCRTQDPGGGVGSRSNSSHLT